MKPANWIATALLMLSLGCGTHPGASETELVPEGNGSSVESQGASETVCQPVMGTAGERIAAECLDGQLSGAKSRRLASKLSAWSRVNGSFPKELIYAQFTQKQFPELKSENWTCLIKRLCN